MFTVLFIDYGLYFALIGGPYGAQPMGLASEGRLQVRYGKLYRILHFKTKLLLSSHFKITLFVLS